MLSPHGAPREDAGSSAPALISTRQSRGSRAAPDLAPVSQNHLCAGRSCLSSHILRDVALQHLGFRPVCHHSPLESCGPGAFLLLAGAPLPGLGREVAPELRLVWIFPAGLSVHSETEGKLPLSAWPFLVWILGGILPSGSVLVGPSLGHLGDHMCPHTDWCTYDENSFPGPSSSH